MELASAITHVTQLAPTIPGPDLALAPDDLAGATLQGLSRPIGFGYSLPRTLFLGLLSFGVLPVLAWVRRFNDFATLEQQQLWHLAEWVRLHSTHPEAGHLVEDAQRLRPRPILQMLSRFCVLLLVFTFAIYLAGFRRHRFGALVGSTYGHTSWGRAFFHSAIHDPIWMPFRFHRISSHMFAIGAVLLLSAYALHWLHVVMHAADVRRFIQRLDRVTLAQGLGEIVPARSNFGLSPLWIVCAVALAAVGVPWAPGMLLAGAAQRNYIWKVSLKDRAQLAHRLRALLVRGGPPIDVPMPVYLRRQCPHRLCKATVNDDARFCTRCGTRLTRSVNRLA